MGAKIGGIIENVWFARVGLSNPFLPSRKLEDFGRDFVLDEAKQLSHTYIGCVNDAFVEVVKRLNRDEVRAAFSEWASAPARYVRSDGTAVSESTPVFIPHIYDEAMMLLRSFDVSLPTRPIRGRHSKVQKSV